MNERVGFIGDIHGEVGLLDEILERATSQVSRLVFLGDYVNRGPNSKEVIDRLLKLSSDGTPVTFLAGNHDVAFLRAITEGNFTTFLRMGGAATLVSYFDGPVKNLSAQTQRAVPGRHIKFLSALRPHEHRDGYFAQHDPNHGRSQEYGYGIFGHLPQQSLVPSIGRECALLDTGCGTFPDGRLTCFIWPDRSWFQASSDRS